MSLLQVNSVGRREGDRELLRQISFTQHPSQRIAIAGETGSGKSTLLKIIAGLVQPTTGSVFFEAKRVLGPEEKLMAGHEGIAYLSQHFELRNHYRVQEVLEMANRLGRADLHRITEICRVDDLLGRWTHQLSGGERQRISLAGQLLSSPRLLLLDEPFSNLDAIHKTILKGVIHEVGEALRITCILVSHDPLDLLSWADEILILKGGRLHQRGTPAEIYYRPADEYAAALFGSYTLMEGRLVDLIGSLSGEKPERFLRPSRIVLAGSGVEGVLQNIKFLGGYYELEVGIGDQSISLHSDRSDLTQGMRVYLRLREV